LRENPSDTFAATSRAEPNSNPVELREQLVRLDGQAVERPLALAPSDKADGDQPAKLTGHAHPVPAEPRGKLADRGRASLKRQKQVGGSLPQPLPPPGRVMPKQALGT